MQDILPGLRAFHFGSVLLRILLAMFCGALVGLGRARKNRAAGLRTYMLISIGAALSVLISIYEYEMLTGAWAEVALRADMKFDVTRYAAQVISGVGFLGAGTILMAAHRQVNGLTSATGLFATVCLGLAAGAGFYECVVIGLAMTIFAMEGLEPLEVAYKRRIRNITVFVEFSDLQDIGTITQIVEGRGGRVFDIDMERMEADEDAGPSAIFTIKLGREKPSHSGMLSSIAELPCVAAVQELIA